MNNGIYNEGANYFRNPWNAKFFVKQEKVVKQLADPSEVFGCNQLCKKSFTSNSEIFRKRFFRMQHYFHLELLYGRIKRL